MPSWLPTINAVTTTDANRLAAHGGVPWHKRFFNRLPSHFRMSDSVIVTRPNQRGDDMSSPQLFNQPSGTYTMNTSSWICCGLLAAMTSIAAKAAEATIGPVNIDRVLIFNTAYGPYQAGDFELVLSSGTPGSTALWWPPGLNCTDRLVTTHRSSDPKMWMLKLATEVQFWAGATASVTITDDATKQAYPGHCSLLAIKR